MSRDSRFRTLRTWHRRIGLTLFAWVFLVALTGIALNHTDGLSLDEHKITSELLLNRYGIERPPLVSYPVDGHWLSLVGGDRLFFNDRDMVPCRELRGATNLSGNIVAACGDSLLVMDVNGRLLERLGPVHGIPAPLDALGYCGDRPCLRSGGSAYPLTPALMDWQPVPVDAFRPALARPLPQALADSIGAANVPADMNWEKLVRDIHSGRFFGLGPWLMDAFALVLMILAITGFLLWRQAAKRRR